MAVLLKTASVRVSSIQIMQVRVQNKGKSVWKSTDDGDVSYIPTMGFLKCLRSSWARKLDAHPLSFFDELSYIYSSSASVAWQSLLLALTSIDGHLPSPLISRVDVRLSPFFLLHITPIIIFYSTHRVMSMGRAHLLRESWKSLRILKYETIAWLVIGVVHDESIFVWRKWSIAKLYDFVGISFLWLCYFDKT